MCKVLIELYLDSNVEKSPNGVPFSPTAHTAENVGFVITCTECKKPRLLHSRKKIKDDVAGAKRMMGKVTYMCGAVLSEFLVNGRDKDERFLNTIFVRYLCALTFLVNRKSSFPIILLLATPWYAFTVALEAHTGHSTLLLSIIQSAPTATISQM